MDIYFVACKGYINNANRLNKDQACQKLKEICLSTLKNITLPGGADEREDITQSLYEKAEQVLVAFLNE